MSTISPILSFLHLSRIVVQDVCGQSPCRKAASSCQKERCVPNSLLAHVADLLKLVRDEWDNKKPEFEAQLLELLGTPWKFDINPLAIYPYAEEGSYGHHSLGSCIAA